MIEKLRKADALRRTAAAQADPWHSVGKDIFDEENMAAVAICDTAARATYIVELHNQILSICAMLFQLCKKKMDRVQMTKEQVDEQ